MSRRLIDADALKDEILTWATIIGKPHLLGAKETMYVIDEAPTIDAVEVIRCKDCSKRPTCKHTRALGINGYCSDAERKNDG
jgi:hypothetical protein